MSDVGIGILSGAGAVLAVVVALLVLALKLSSTKDDNRDLAVENADLKAQGRIDATTINRLSDELKREQGVSDAIEDSTAHDPGPVDGAFDRLLLEGAVPDRRAADAAGGGGPVTVPSPTPARGDAGRDALERPE